MAIKWKNSKKKEYQEPEYQEPEHQETEHQETERQGQEQQGAAVSVGNGVKGILLILLLAAAAATVMCCFYPFFRGRAQQRLSEYQKKYEAEGGVDAFYEADEMFLRYLRSSIYYLNYEMTPNMDAYTYLTQNYEMDKFTEEEQNRIREAATRLMKNMRNQYSVTQTNYDFSSYGSGPDRNFGNEYLRDAVYGNSEYAREYYRSGLVIQYDSRGVPSIRESWGLSFDEPEILGYLQQVSMMRLMEDNGLGDVEYETIVGTYDGTEIEETVIESADEFLEAEPGGEYADPYEEASHNDRLLRSIPAPVVQNSTFVFAIHGNENWENDWRDYWVERSAYMRSGYSIGVMMIVLCMVFLALLLQNVPVLELRKYRLFRLPTELVAYAGIIGVLVTGAFAVSDFGIYTLAGHAVEDFEDIGFGGAAQAAVTTFIWVFWFCFALCWYWLTASVLPYLTHPIRMLKENMLCIHICRWLKNLWLKFWHWATDVELDEKLTRNIWKVVGLNGVIVVFLCCIWFGGIVGAVIYTILLYVLIKKKCGEILENYQKLLQVTSTIAEGDLTISMEADMGVFNPVRDELTSIRNGFRKAVNDEVRSRNMKTELITNVSHDLKTPLTAIITYVDLLKKEDLTEEQRNDYIATLDKKSQRLRVLIEDLFEVSKAASDNIVMNFDDVDLVSLIKQVRLENEDRIQECTLDFRWNLPEEKCVLMLDPQRTFRVIDNLIQNILKYSMPHSRVYIDLKDRDGEVTVSFKNMSASEMNFSPEEITERFVRGDLSRNTEGSGLGLAIAQSFTELQNGTFRVETDGDLFKVTIGFKKDTVLS